MTGFTSSVLVQQILTSPFQHPTIVELHHQLGNLQAQLTGSQDALEREKQRTHRIRSERDDARRELVQLTQNLQQQTWLINDLKKKITEQARELHEQSIKLDKQKKTIKVQSDTISGKPHTSDRVPFMTPAHKDTRLDLTDETPSGAAATARRAHINHKPPPPFPLGRPAPKAGSAPSLQPQQSSVAQALVPHGESAPSRKQREPGSIPSGLVPYESSASQDIDYLGGLHYLFSLTESWARNYANVTSVSRDSKLPTSFMESMTPLSGPNSAASILSNIRTRHFVVAAYINRHLVKEVLVVTALNGFKGGITYKLEGTATSLFKSKCYSLARSLLDETH